MSVMPPSDPLPVAKLNISSSKSLPPPRNHHVLPNLGIAPPHKHHALPYQHEFAKLPPTRPDYEGASASVGNFLPILPGIETNTVHQENPEEVAARREAQQETHLPRGAWICCETVQDSGRRRCSRCQGWKSGRRSLLKSVRKGKKKNNKLGTDKEKHQKHSQQLDSP